jgi:hypothetical protein
VWWREMKQGGCHDAISDAEVSMERLESKNAKVV